MRVLLCHNWSNFFSVLYPYDTPNISRSTYIAVWADACIVGFLVPGASAGIGVHEALMISALTTAGMADSTILVTLAFLIPTTIGDVLFAGLGVLLGRVDRRALVPSRPTQAP